MLKGIGREATYYYHPDHLGSVSVVSNHRGEPYERVEYLPFGEIWIEETDPATGYIPFRFTSKELDEETGLYYYGARYYEPATSRWMSPDPAGFELVNPENNEHLIISGMNWYSYTENNPVKYNDPTGGIPTVALGAITGAVVGAITGGISAAVQGNTSFREIAGGVAGGAISGAVTGALIGSGVGIIAIAGGSAVGGAVASVTENMIVEGAKNLDAGAVAKDAAIDGGISAMASVAAVGLGKGAKAIVKSFHTKASKTTGGLLKKATAMGKAMKIEKAITVAKPAAEAGIGLYADIRQDKTGVPVEKQTMNDDQID